MGNKIELRPYQQGILNEVKETFKTFNDVVIAAAPSSGKTMMTIKFIQDNPDKDFLILTHGQNVLKDMWAEELKKFLGEFKNVVFGLPQSLSKKDLAEVDYVVIDEAHEFTFASMAKKILDKNKKAKKIYLTGTPSKFIKEKYHTIIIPAIDLIDQGFISDLYVGLFSTQADIRSDDRNTERDLTGDGSKKLEKTVESDINSLLKEMIRRLKSTKLTKNGPYRALLSKKFDAFGVMNKTMIACASIKQANKVNEYLNKNGVKSVLSNSENDKDSEFIVGEEGFLKNPEINVLVVVDRGILGFNMPDLVNVVDMTGSHNINRIYQLYARVMRKNDKLPNKYFFKIATVQEMQVTKFYMEASLCLMFKEFISKYDGTNLDSLEIPVNVRKKKKRGEDKKGKGKTKPRTINVPEELFNVVSAAKILKDLYNNASKEFNEYAMIKFKDIRRDVFGDNINLDYSSAESLWKDLLSTGIVDEKFDRV